MPPVHGGMPCLSSFPPYSGTWYVYQQFLSLINDFQKWNGTFFEDSPLKYLGLRIQLGHPIGEKCLNPERAADDDFTVITSHGIHTIGLNFCGCGKSSQDHVIQLLRIRLFPATIKYPKTAATFDCLETFEKLSYVSKISAFEFYQTASRLTDDTGTKTPKVSLFLSTGPLTTKADDHTG